MFVVYYIYWINFICYIYGTKRSERRERERKKRIFLFVQKIMKTICQQINSNNYLINWSFYHLHEHEWGKRSEKMFSSLFRRRSRKRCGEREREIRGKKTKKKWTNIFLRTMYVWNEWTELLDKRSSMVVSSFVWQKPWADLVDVRVRRLKKNPVLTIADISILISINDTMQFKCLSWLLMSFLFYLSSYFVIQIFLFSMRIMKRCFFCLRYLCIFLLIWLIYSSISLLLLMELRDNFKILSSIFLIHSTVFDPHSLYTTYSHT